MKILIYSANYAPEPTGIGKYSSEMAEWLVKAGHEVRVVCAPPYYPDWKLGEGYRAWLYSTETLNGVQVHRAPLWVPSRLNGTTRILHLLSFAASSFPSMLRQVFWRPDVVWTVVPAFFCAPGGWLTARLCGARAWMHVQDFEIDVAFKLGMLEGGWLKKSVAAVERFIFRRFDRVSTISHRMLVRAREKGVRTKRLTFFPNWVNTELIKPLTGPSEYRAELGLPDNAVVALYSGSLGAKHGLPMIPEVARKLAHIENLFFVVCGNGVLKPHLEAAAAELPNLKLLPLQPLERLGQLLGLADIHLLPQSPGAEDLVMPSKLSGMLASGRPVVATCHLDTELASAVFGKGLVVPPEDIDALAQAVERLALAPNLRDSLGDAGRRYAEAHLVTDVVLERFAEALGQIVVDPATVPAALGVNDEMDPQLAGPP